MEQRTKQPIFDKKKNMQTFHANLSIDLYTNECTQTENLRNKYSEDKDNVQKLLKENLVFYE